MSCASAASDLPTSTTRVLQAGERKKRKETQADPKRRKGGKKKEKEERRRKNLRQTEPTKTLPIQKLWKTAKSRGTLSRKKSAKNPPKKPKKTDRIPTQSYEKSIQWGSLRAALRIHARNSSLHLSIARRASKANKKPGVGTQMYSVKKGLRGPIKCPLPRQKALGAVRPWVPVTLWFTKQAVKNPQKEGTNPPPSRGFPWPSLGRGVGEILMHYPLR